MIKLRIIYHVNSETFSAVTVSISTTDITTKKVLGVIANIYGFSHLANPYRHSIFLFICTIN